MKKTAIRSERVERLVSLFSKLHPSFQEALRAEFPHFSEEEKLLFLQLLQKDIESTNASLAKHLPIAKAA